MNDAKELIVFYNSLNVRRDAHVLANMIRDYWAKQGKRVGVKIVQEQVNGKMVLAIRSDLVNGLPK